MTLQVVWCLCAPWYRLGCNFAGGLVAERNLVSKGALALQVVWWSSFEKQYEAEVAAEAEIFGGEAGKARREDLRLRVTEHNVLVVAKYYARITLARLSQLLDLPPAEVIAVISLPVLLLSWSAPDLEHPPAK